MEGGKEGGKGDRGVCIKKAFATARIPISLFCIFPAPKYLSISLQVNHQPD
jgi:hypothetical protein